MLVWQPTEEGSKGRNPPSMVPLLGDPKAGGRRDSLELDELLARRQAKRQAELAGMKGTTTDG